MKNLLKSVSVLLLVVLSFSSFGQDLRKLPEAKRVKILTEEAKRVILKHGPGYYREFEPTIELASVNLINQEIKYYNYVNSDECAKVLPAKNLKNVRSYSKWVTNVIKGRMWYVVTFSYDKNEESFAHNFSAQVYVWTDTQQAFQIIFGNMRMVYDLDLPEDTNKEIEQIKYVKNPRLK